MQGGKDGQPRSLPNPARTCSHFYRCQLRLPQVYPARCRVGAALASAGSHVTSA